MVKEKSISEMSADELQAILNQKKKQENEEKQTKRKAYEDERDGLINVLGTLALEAFGAMEALKRESMAKLTSFRDKMLDYGDLRGGTNNKGNFEIKNGNFKIQFSTQVVKQFDERALIAEEKMNKFLNSFVKKRDKQTFELVSALMKRREETGEFDHDSINRLYALEDQFDDPNWKEALALFKESYSPTTTSRYVRFYLAKDNGGWEPVVLDFAKLRTKELVVNG